MVVISVSVFYIKAAYVVFYLTLGFYILEDFIDPFNR